jgi:histidine kinase
MFEKFQGQTWLVRLTAGYYGCVHPWKRPVRETLAPLKRAHEAGLESGDIEFSILSLNFCFWSQLEYGPLPELERQIRQAVNLMDLHGQLSMRIMISGVWQTILNLMGRSSVDVCVISGDAMDASTLKHWEDPRGSLHMWINYRRMVLCYLFGRYEEASDHAAGCQELINKVFLTTGVCSIVLFETLTYLALERSSRKRGRMKVISHRIREMKNWAQHSPYNFSGMQFLLEAELAVLKDDKNGALSKYVCAILVNKQVGALQLAALSNERLGKFLLEQGQQSEAKPYLDEALKYYEEYGAVAKVDHLRSEIHHVLF